MTRRLIPTLLIAVLQASSNRCAALIVPPRGSLQRCVGGQCAGSWLKNGRPFASGTLRLGKQSAIGDPIFYFGSLRTNPDIARPRTVLIFKGAHASIQYFAFPQRDFEHAVSAALQRAIDDISYPGLDLTRVRPVDTPNKPRAKKRK